MVVKNHLMLVIEPYFLGRFPGFRPSRGSTAGLFYGAPPGLRIPLASLANTPSTSDLSSLWVGDVPFCNNALIVTYQLAVFDDEHKQKV